MLGIIVDFAREFLLADKNFDKVLDVGSRNINGSLKELFSGRCQEYIGLDLCDGKGVDIVADAENLLEIFPGDTFDCVVCCETLEHTKNPLLIVENMRKVLKPGGWLFITTPSIGHPIHDWPNDYYRFFESTFRDVFLKNYLDCVVKSMIWDSPYIVEPNSQYPHAIMGYGRKP